MTSDLAEFLAGRGGETPPADPAGLADSIDDSTDPPGGAGAAGRRAGRSIVLFRDRFEILPNRPLGALGGRGVSAFAARDGNDPGNFCAYVIKPGLPPRLDCLDALRGLRHPAMVEIVDAGIVDWPPDGAERLIVLTAAPRGQPLARAAGQPVRALPPDRLVPAVVRPVVSLLKELSARRVVHGSINPATLFLPVNGANAAVQLGECVTLPAGFAQPLAFETIQRGQARPAGRGPGVPADDLYALGATLLACLLGRVPGADGDALLAAKVERGSFAALTDEVRLPAALADLVRGLLADDEAQRWTLDDVELWLGERRPAPKPPCLAPKATRSLSFAGREHWNGRTLAAAVIGDPAGAWQLVESGRLRSWLDRGLKHAPTLARMEVAGRAATPGRTSDMARAVARIAVALDPEAPIRLKDAAVLPQGLGPALAEGVIDGTAQDIIEILSARLPHAWVDAQAAPRPDLAPVLERLGEAQAHLERHVPGYGIERCLYELNPAVPCLSPMLERFYVQDLAGLLGALEAVAGGEGRPREPVDRHVAAFVAARVPELRRDVLIALHDQGTPAARSLAMLTLLAEAQRQAGGAPSPALASWLSGLLGPAVSSFHSRSLRERLQTALEEQARAGLLGNLAALIRNASLVQRDDAGFAQAERRFASLVRQIAGERKRLADRGALANGPGRHAAAIVSAAVAVAASLATVLTHVG